MFSDIAGSTKYKQYTKNINLLHHSNIVITFMLAQSSTVKQRTVYYVFDNIISVIQSSFWDLQVNSWLYFYFKFIPKNREGCVTSPEYFWVFAKHSFSSLASSILFSICHKGIFEKLIRFFLSQNISFSGILFFPVLPRKNIFHSFVLLFYNIKII